MARWGSCTNSFEVACLEAKEVKKERRGVYAVSRKATIPLLVIMAAAVDMTENKQQAIQESDE